MRIPDNAVDHGGHVPADAYDQSAGGGQFVRSKVCRASSPDLHGWHPAPSKIGKIAPIGGLISLEIE